VPVLGDVIAEANETFNVDLSNATHATISDTQGVGTIIDNDGVSLSISDASVTEGNTGTTATMTFTISLSKASDQDVTVDYTTVDGTATVADHDYDAVSDTAMIPHGQTSTTITVMVNGDDIAEGNEVFTVNLSNPTNATILKEIGVGTIIDDDG